MSFINSVSNTIVNRKISVLMAVHNGELYLKEAIESILSQTFSDFEFIIINDCSTDDSEIIIRSFSDDRIKLYTNNCNLGLTKSLNLGLNLCGGQYIARMDADDISHPDRFLKQIKFLDENLDYGVCGSWYTLFDDSGSIHVAKLIEQHNLLQASLLIKNQMGHPTIMLRKSVLDNNNIRYDENLITSQDYNLWLRLSIVCKLYNIQESLLDYRIHPNQVVSSKKNIAKKYTHSGRIIFLQELIKSTFSTEEDVVLYKSYFNQSLSLAELKILKNVYENVRSNSNVRELYDDICIKKVFNQRFKHTLRIQMKYKGITNWRYLKFYVQNDIIGLIKSFLHK